MVSPHRQRVPGRERVSDVAVVVVAPDAPIDSVLKKFKRQCERAGIFRELKRRERFSSPSERRRSKSKRARKRDAKTAGRREGDG